MVESCGGLGIQVADRAGLEAALERALAYDGPAMVEALIDAALV